MDKAPQPVPVVVDTSRSRHARLRPVPITAVRFTDLCWAPRRKINHEATLAQQFEQLETSHRLDNFRRVSGKVERPFEGPIFNDTDVYKWLEAAAWTLATEHDAEGPTALPGRPELERMVDIAIAELAAAQQPNGYLHTYFVGDKEHERWTNPRDLHEMYNAGHLIQAAVAHYRATGSTRLLEIARRFADHICQIFGPAEEGKRAETDGHEEIELALVELARATGDEKYRRQAQFFVDVRGHGSIGGRPYHQDHQPFRELDAMVGGTVSPAHGTPEYRAGPAGGADGYSVLRLGHQLHRPDAGLAARRRRVTIAVGGRDASRFPRA